MQAASAGDTVRVAAGIYREPTVVLDKRRTLIGEPGAVLDGQGERSVILITADSLQVVGLSIGNTGVSQIEDRAGILVDKSQFCSIRDNELDATFFGIDLVNSSDCEISGNRLRASWEARPSGSFCYTGAGFQDFFGGGAGLWMALGRFRLVVTTSLKDPQWRVSVRIKPRRTFRRFSSVLRRGRV